MDIEVDAVDLIASDIFNGEKYGVDGAIST